VPTQEWEIGSRRSGVVKPQFQDHLGIAFMNRINPLSTRGKIRDLAGSATLSAGAYFFDAISFCDFF
jgi:hypothetical protein